MKLQFDENVNDSFINSKRINKLYSTVIKKKNSLHDLIVDKENNSFNSKDFSNTHSSDFDVVENSVKSVEDFIIGINYIKEIINNNMSLERIYTSIQNILIVLNSLNKNSKIKRSISEILIESELIDNIKIYLVEIGIVNQFITNSMRQDIWEKVLFLKNYQKNIQGNEIYNYFSYRNFFSFNNISICDEMTETCKKVSNFLALLLIEKLWKPFEAVA